MHSTPSAKLSATELRQQHQQQQQQQKRTGMSSKKPTTTAGLLGRSSPFAVTSTVSDPSSLVQCARKRLQYSQLPVRAAASNSKKSGNHHQHQQLVGSIKYPLLDSPKRCVSAKNCTEEARQTGGSPASKKKCISLIDLSLARKRSGDFGSLAELCTETGSSSARLDDRDEREGSPLIRKPRFSLRRDEKTLQDARAAGLVCRALVLNAWRRRKVEVLKLHTALNNVNEQVKNLELQIVVLRSLHDKDKERVQSLANELHRAKVLIEEMTKERDQLRLEKETTEAEARRERETAEERAVSLENLRNELRSARDKLQTLDDQIVKDREELARLGEEKQNLIDKLSASEALAEERNARATKAELSLDETETQLAKQHSVINALQTEVQRYLNLLREREDQRLDLEETILRLEKENASLDERLRISEEAEGTLSTRAAYLENQVFHQETKIRRIEAEYNAQLIEFNELRERFVRQSEECNWSSRLMQIVGSVSHVPRVILRTLSFFSSRILFVL